MQTGLLLILGTISLIVGWLVIYPADPQGTTTEQALSLMGDANTAQFGIFLGFGGMIAAMFGLINLARGMAMAGGSGASFANVAMMLGVALVSAFVVSAGLELGVTEAPTPESGVMIMGVALAIQGSVAPVFGILLLLLAAGIMLDKNLHIAAGGLAGIAGILMLVGIFAESDPVEFASWIAMFITLIVLGVFTLRSNN